MNAAGMRGAGRRWLLAATTIALLGVAASGSLSPQTAAAELPPLLWQSPKDGKPGGEGGRYDEPRGIGVEPASAGHLFVADTANNRIGELDVWGQFERTWGWEVVAAGPGDDSAIDETQRLTVSATAGTYKLRYFDASNAENNFVHIAVPIAFDAPAGAVQAAFTALAPLEPGDVVVTGGPGDAGGTSPYEIQFGGSYADTGIPDLTVVESTLSGGSGATVQIAQEGGSFEICVPSNGDVCQEGQGGGYGAGQFGGREGPLGGVAVDGNGDVYVFETVTGNFKEEESFRVQKFDNDGDFLLMWGGEVNKTTGADRCTKADVDGGDACGTGVSGIGEGEFASITAADVGNKIAVGPTGTVFVGDKERIQAFDPQGHYLGEVALPGETVRALAMDGAGNFHIVYAGKNHVRKLSPAGVEMASFKAESPTAVAVGTGGRVYVDEDPFGPFFPNQRRILGYEPNGTCFICAEDDFRATPATQPTGLATSTACGIPGEDLYSSYFGEGESFLRAYGPPPDPDVEGCEPPDVPPEIEDQYASAVGTDGATVRAEINPQFWPDARYYVEWGTGKCSEGGCQATQPTPPGLLLTNQVTNQGVKSAAISLSGLSPDTTYHYRFVAQSGGGGPVFGIDPDGEGPLGASVQDGEEGTFKTFKLPASPAGCANDPFRNGPGAFLPDCRAYEMVSPAEKANGDIVALTDAERNAAALNQSSSDGNKLTYSAYRAFGDPESAPISSQYIAGRGAAGWESAAISPPRGVNFLELVQSLNNQFKAFSDDLCEAWLLQTDPPLAPGAIEGFANLYRRDNCEPGAGGYDALTTVEPPTQEPRDYVPELQGVSTDGEHAIFRTRDKLTPDAPVLASGPDGLGIDLLYEAYGDGQLRFVCVRPNGSVVSAGCVAGTASGNAKRSYGREHAVDNAISDDGKRIFWSESTKGPGRLFVRIEGKRTLQLASNPAQYWGAAADGSLAIFTIGDLDKGEATLRRYDVGAEKAETIAGGVYGVMGASEDARRIYFGSGESLAAGASAGKPNLYYVDEAGGFHLIGILSAEDAGAVTVSSVTPLNIEPNRHTAQVTATGLHAAFMATASLTGHDSTDVQSGRPAAEVFHYDAESDALRCASCNPTGARPTGREIGGGTWAASQIPGAQTQLYAVPRVLTDDGARLFFESFQPLVANDTNGKADVYQWEEPGKGSCTQARPTYNPAAGGCVDPISSGQSPSDSTIADASPSGNDLFFATASSLLPGRDPDDLIDVYDARLGGGFPEPAPLPEPCQGEACQAPSPPPPEVTPSSSAYEGPGNPKATPRRRRCAKGKRAVRRGGKVRCVKRTKGQRKRSRRSGGARR